MAAGWFLSKNGQHLQLITGAWSITKSHSTGSVTMGHLLMGVSEFQLDSCWMHRQAVLKTNLDLGMTVGKRGGICGIYLISTWSCCCFIFEARRSHWNHPAVTSHRNGLEMPRAKWNVTSWSRHCMEISRFACLDWSVSIPVRVVSSCQVSA